MTSSTKTAGVFAILFFISLATLGGLLGSFADSDRAFVDHFSDGGERARDIVGSICLALAGVTLLWFAIGLTTARGDHRTRVIVAAAVAAGGMILAALALATVPLSISFGTLTDDPGIGAGQAAIAQFGIVVLGLGAMIPAAAFMVVVARLPGLLPRWLQRATYPMAAIVLVLSLAVGPMVLLALWFAGVSVSLWRRRSPIALRHP